MANKRDETLRFDVPFTAGAPALCAPGVGIAKLVQRHCDDEQAEVTVLDTSDNRLLRAGVVLAHRVVDSRGEWCLSAPEWQPWLPSELSEPLGANAELPGEFSKLVRPLTRGAMLGPVAALECEVSEFVLKGEVGNDLAVIRDERRSVQRSGVVTARYREVSVCPTAQLTPQQRSFIIAALETSSATPVDSFPSLRQRLGPPATGLTDYPDPRELHKNMVLEDFVASVFSQGLRDLTRALLELGSAEEPELAGVDEALQMIHNDVQGLASVLDPRWRKELQQYLAEAPVASVAGALSCGIAVADALVGAIRAPRLGDVSQREAAGLLAAHAEQAAYIFADRCRALRPEAADEKWSGALQAAEQLAQVTHVAERLLGKPARKLHKRLSQVLAELRVCIPVARSGEYRLEGLSLEEAFALGRQLEQHRAQEMRHRERFVEAWPSEVAELRKLMLKVKRRV